MKRFFTSAVGRSVSLGFTLILVATLATVLFSFLGTITCGALVGLMLGSGRKWKWQAIPVSFVFPAVITVYLQGWKTDLSSQQSVLLALVCLGSFWMTYLATFILLSFEKPPASADTSPPPSAQESDAEAISASAAATPSLEALSMPGLDDLQGTWSREIRSTDGQPCKKVIEVDRDKLAFGIVSNDGRTQCLYKGVLRLEHLGPFKILRVLEPKAELLAASTEGLDLSSTWIYRIADGTLTIAENFEETVCNLEPVMETYVKLPPHDHPVAPG